MLWGLANTSQGATTLFPASRKKQIPPRREKKPVFLTLTLFLSPGNGFLEIRETCFAFTHVFKKGGSFSRRTV